MVAALNLLVALVLTVRAWRAAHRFEGGLAPTEHLLIFLLMTGMFQTGGVSLGMNLSAWRLLAWILLIGLVLALSRPALPRLTATDLPIILYGAFLLWCVYRLTAAPSLGYGVRNLLKIIYPFMVLLLARKAARPGHLGVYLVPMIGASLIISLFASGVSEKVPYLVYNPFLYGIFWPRPTFADHAAIMIGVILVVLWIYRAYVPTSARRVYLCGVVWLVLSPLAVACRTGLLATAAAISGYAVLRYRALALPALGGLLLLGAAAFLFIPGLRGETFYDAEGVTFRSLLQGDVEVENINSTGRFATWEALLEKFYEPSPLQGSGLGAVQEDMYTAADAYGIKAAHCEYVMLLCDTGWVGLLLYLGAVAGACGVALQCLRVPVTAERKAAAALVVTSFLACLCAMGFDNVFLYTLPVHSLPFAFTGILLGLIRNYPGTVIENPWWWSQCYIWSRLLPAWARPARTFGVPAPAPGRSMPALPWASWTAPPATRR